MYPISDNIICKTRHLGNTVTLFLLIQISTPYLSYTLKTLTVEGVLEYISTKNVQKNCEKFNLRTIWFQRWPQYNFVGEILT